MSDLLGLPHIFHPRNFGCLRPKTTFSTATGGFTQNPRRTAFEWRFLTNRMNVITDLLGKTMLSHSSRLLPRARLWIRHTRYIRHGQVHVELQDQAGLR